MNLITVKEWAYLCDRTPWAAQRAIHEGKVNAKKVGCHYFVDKETPWPPSKKPGRKRSK